MTKAIASSCKDLSDQRWLAARRLELAAEQATEPQPFFFSANGRAMALEGQYPGSAAFLIANGPSFRNVDASLLSNCWTMTLNNGSATYRGIANCTVDEPSRFSLSTWLDPRIIKFAPVSHYEKPLWDNRRCMVDGKWVQNWSPSTLCVRDCPNVVGYLRNERFDARRWLREDTINWGNNARFGGGRSVLLAALRILYIFGFRRIYLLGVDFEMSADKAYHFDEYRGDSAIRGNMRTYARLHGWLEELQPLFLAEGFVVKNCNPSSNLKVFPFIKLEDAVAEALASLGDYTREVTRGMYRSAGERIMDVSPRGVDDNT